MFVTREFLLTETITQFLFSLKHFSENFFFKNGNTKDQEKGGRNSYRESRGTHPKQPVTKHNCFLRYRRLYHSSARKRESRITKKRFSGFQPYRESKSKCQNLRRQIKSSLSPQIQVQSGKLP